MPTNRNAQSYMGLAKATAPEVDANGIVRNFIYSPRFAAKVAAYTVTAKETGTFFTTVGATMAIIFTLPAISEGPWVYKFINAVDLAMIVTAGTADTMIGFNDVDLDSIAAAQAGELIGSIINAYCDGTKLIVSAEGSSEVTTFALTD